MKKKIFLTILLIISTLLFLSFSFANTKIKVGYYEDYPLVFKDESGNPSGFFVNIINEMFKNEDYEIEYVYGTWKEMLDYLESGEIDLVLDILKNEKRDKIYDFNEKPILLSWGKVCVNREYKVDSLLDLENLKIGYMDSDYYAVEKDGLIEMTNVFELNVDYYPYKSYRDVLEAVEKNEVNAGIINKLTVNQIYDYNNIKDTSIVFAASGVKVASLNNENEEILSIIDENLNKWKDDKNSFYYKEYKYWFNSIIENYLRVFFYENESKIFLMTLIIISMITISRADANYKSKKLINANKDIDSLANKFENLIKFLSFNIKKVYKNGNDLFLVELLKESFELVPEADSGLVFKFYNDKVKVINSVNYNKSELNEICVEIRESIINNDSEINIFDKRFLLFFNEKLEVVSGLLLEIDKDKQLSFSKDSIRIIRILKNTAESYFLNESIHEINESFQREIIFSIIQMLEIHDEYTKGHSESVADLASRLAGYIGFSEKKVNEIYWTGLVHDIGKILIDKSIITKEGKLTLEEFETIKKHPEFGYKALRKSKATKEIAKYVLSHHERVDGLGYPDGLMGKEIPVESKIISIVDSYDAMISTRSYRSSISSEEALQEIENNLN